MEPVNTGSHLGSLAQIGSRFERECSQACGGLGIGRPGSQVQEDNFPFALGGSFQAESLAMPGCPNPIDFRGFHRQRRPNRCETGRQWGHRYVKRTDAKPLEAPTPYTDWSALRENWGGS